MIIRFLTLAIAFSFSILLNAQDKDSIIIAKIFKEALTNYTSYNQLQQLCRIAPGRISGTQELEKAINFTYEEMKAMQLDNVFLQKVMVPNWKRGDKEIAWFESKGVRSYLSVCGLGTGIGTGEDGLKAKVIEVKDFDAIKDMPEEKVKGKIVFFNEPMDGSSANGFAGYGRAGTQRVYGASVAGEKGAAGAIIRSATSSIDDFPHTGVMRYKNPDKKVPVVSVSTIGANKLSNALKENPNLDLFFRTTSYTLPDVESHNVVGEIKGAEHPEEIIVVGGHIDAWFTGQGAHDDGAGCIHAIEVLRLFRALNIQPKHTIRAVMFVDEEISQTGGKEYARLAKENNEKHILALESDAGGFSPRGFSIDGNEETIKHLQSFTSYFKPYGIHEIKKGYGGVDISPLKSQGTPLVSFMPDNQRYFDYHHAATDKFEAVNFRELQMGSAAIAAFVYLVDQYGL